MPYGCLVGSSTNSTPRVRNSLYVVWMSSVVKKMVPAKPLASRVPDRLCAQPVAATAGPVGRTGGIKTTPFAAARGR